MKTTQSPSYSSGSISEVRGALTCSTTTKRLLVGLLAELTCGLVAPRGRRPDERPTELGGALTYPLIMMSVGTGIVLFLLTYVVPQVATIFVQQHAALPLATKLLIRFSALISRHWLAVTIPFAVVVVGIGGALATRPGRRLYQHYDRKLAQSSPQITEWLEPVMTLAMPAIIVFMMLAVLMPIFQFNQLMQ